MIKRRLIKLLSWGLALFIASFTLFSSLVIFWRTVEIVQSLSYTKEEQYGIVGIVGFMLIWLCSMATNSADDIIKSGNKKAASIKE